jgi:hypothetical protein
VAEQYDGTSMTREAVARPARANGIWLRARRLPFELVCFPIVSAVYGLHFLVSGYDRFYYDSEQYWQLGGAFERNGHFSLLAYSYPWRGWSVPLLSYVLQVIGSPAGLSAVTTVKIFGALLAATVGVILIPRLARRLFPGAVVGPGRVLVLNALIFLYWRDHFDFPLSDFPALAVGIVGVLALLRATAIGYVIAGLCLGLATNIRPNYLLAAVAAVAVAALIPLRPWNWRRRSAAAALALVGVLLGSLPQMLINHQHYGSWSPSIQESRTVTLANLWLGMRAQKYETYVGPPTQYPQPGVSYLDPATIHVVQQEHISPVILSGHPAFPSYGKYVHVVFDHPVQVVASYARHIFNGLDVRYPTPYIRDLRNTSIFISLVQYTLIFMAIARLVIPDARRALGRIHAAGLAVIPAACLLAIPIMAEPRYYLPLDLPIYLLVCFAPGTRAMLFGGSVARRISLAVSYVPFVLVCLALSTATQAELEHPVQALGPRAGIVVAKQSRPLKYDVLRSLEGGRVRLAASRSDSVFGPLKAPSR